MGGRPKEAEALKKLRGTARKDRELKKPSISNQKGKVTPLSRLPPPPERLGAVGKKLWLENVKILKQSGNWNASYEASLGMYCDFYELYMAALVALKDENAKEFMLRTNYSQLSQPHPSNLVIQYSKTCIQLQKEYGFTPVSNIKVPIIEQDNKDPKKAKALAMFGG